MSQQQKGNIMTKTYIASFVLLAFGVVAMLMDSSPTYNNPTPQDVTLDVLGYMMFALAIVTASLRHAIRKLERKIELFNIDLKAALMGIVEKS